MNPYQSLPQKAFWRPAVADRSLFDIADLWRPKFEIRKDHRIATYGSCFAQHIGSALRARKFNWLDCEPAPYGLNARSAREFNYGVFSSRTGNIYTTSLLRQWTDWALEAEPPPLEIWEKDGRFYDPFRPTIEPNGFDGPDEVEHTREHSIRMFEKSIREADVFIFTLGLTESWINAPGAYEYPVCPGVTAGRFDPGQHRFKNQLFNQVLTNLKIAFNRMTAFNQNLRFLLTVSPVPLTATHSAQHVLVATMQSKSVLRAVAAQLAENWPVVDYFPSYEIINSPAYRGAFFEPNLRTVNPHGVAHVMQHFFSAIGEAGEAVPVPSQGTVSDEESAQCDEELLEAFGKR